ncbi:MAG TPA: hypothetical protein VF297_19995 [Pyrinomonadaceae bacterium]
MAVYEGKWRCTFCHTVCRGRDMNCAGCGARRGEDVEFFLDDDAPPVTDEALLRRADDGPDWLCETCGGSNQFGDDSCQTCGAPRGNSEFRRVTVIPSNVAHGQPAASAARVPWRPPNLNRMAGVAAVAGAGVVVLFLLMVLGLVSSGVRVGPAQKAYGLKAAPTPPVLRKVELAVDRVEWKRSIVVEAYRDVVSEEWAWLVPQDARVISQHEEVHSYDRVKVGSHVVKEYYTERVKVGTRTVTENYTDRESAGTERYSCGKRNRGNGFFEDVYCTRPVYRTVTKTRSKQVDDYQTVSRVREKTVDDYKDVPVYRLKVKYSARRWVPVDTLAARGADLTPRWPEVVLGREKSKGRRVVQEKSEERREGRREESYRVFLRDVQTNKVYERAVSGEEFLLFNAGAKCAATVDGSERIVEFTPPASNPSR